MRNTITSSFSTGEFHGYNVKFSPFRKNLLACAASQNYGIAGSGRLFVLDIQNGREFKVVTTRDYSDGLFDVTWSELNEQLLVTSCGDGSIQIWDYVSAADPVTHYRIHEKEVYSVEWNPKNAMPVILSASWDHTVKVWNPFVCKEIAAYLEHTDQVYEATWCPMVPHLFASVSGDRTLRLWDVRCNTRSNGWYAHDSEVLCCDWSKFDRDVLATGTTNGKIVEWDVRKMAHPLFMLSGHEYAIRQLKFSPHQPGTLASVSYDFTTRFWNWNIPQALQIHKEHKEFVYGLDFNPMKPGQACDCGWDSLLYIYDEVM
ncbi:peroxisomal targeting signal 2 receptor [Parasteatoda tepidariorum]|uniref:Peroxin-7 n=1 Tax=Parasteatoda tepidariorum TaxID=114398 RepID=A0A2L2YIN3_PARTP|nr:peroxisomal targeting signal 2 receptor [Parasteatoda tepidariorum]